MMPADRFERQLPQLLTELAVPRTPDYLDDLLWQTANTSQRPAWSFLERWLPMVDIARQPVIAPRIPWRSIGLTVLLAGITLAILAALIVGSRPRVPAPFGPARNGLVAYANSGDIYTVDAATGTSTMAVTGPETDIEPRWSLDGMQFAFERKMDGESGPGLVFVARADGTGLVRITPEPLARITGYAFSPDGREVLISASPNGDPMILIAAADGSQIRELDVGMPATEAAWRPPDGAEIVFAGGETIDAGIGLYAFDLNTRAVRTIVEPSPGLGLGWIRVAPDGLRVAFDTGEDDPTRNTYRVHVRAIAATGNLNLILPMPEGATFQSAASWSNDGTRLVIVRGYATRNQEIVLAVVPADGGGLGVETKRSLTGCCDTTIEWSPDDSSILMTPEDLLGRWLPQVLLDPLTGASRPAPWAATSYPAWQRLAP